MQKNWKKQAEQASRIWIGTAKTSAQTARHDADDGDGRAVAEQALKQSGVTVTL